MPIIKFRYLTIFIFSLSQILYALPQFNIDIQGRVVDEQGAPLQGAQVSLGQLNTLSNAQGNFQLTGIHEKMKTAPLTLKVSSNGCKNSFYSCSVTDNVGDVILYSNAPSQTPGGYTNPVDMTLYLDDRRGVVTMTFDDTKASHRDIALPLLDSYGYKSTIYLVTDRVGSGQGTEWSDWLAAHNNGHEIGNHTTGHWLKNPQSTENDAWNDDQINRAYQDIQTHIGVAPLTFAFPGGSQTDYTQGLIENSPHIDWRHSWHIKRHDRIYPEGDLMTASEARGYVDDIIAHKPTWHGLEFSWFLFYMHEINSFQETTLTSLCDYIDEKEDQVWATTYARATIYEHMRENSSVNVIGGDTNGLVYTINNSLDKNIFDLPVTIKIPEEASRAWAVTDTHVQDLTLEMKNEGILVSAAPGNSDQITVQWSNGPPPPSQPVVDLFNANPETVLVDYGTSVELNWETSNASEVNIDQGIGGVNPDGSTTVTPNTTTTYTITATEGQNQDQQSVTITVVPSNTPPQANAGSDQVSQTQTQITLDGSNSSDPDDLPEPLSYSWSQTSGPSVTLNNANQTQANFTGSLAGTYTFELTVHDGQLNHTDSVEVTLNEAPPQTLPPEIDDVTPAHTSTSVAVDTHLLITFNKPIYNDEWVTGELQLYKSEGDVLVESWDIQNSHIVDDYHIDITPSQALEEGTSYYVISEGTWIKLSVSPWNMSEPIEQGDWQFTTESSNPVATIDSFSATPSSFSENNPQTVTLSWETTNATNVSIDQGIGNVDIDGQTTVNPITTTTYTLTADDGETIDQQSVTVVVNPNQAPNSNAGPNQTALIQEIVTLDGTASNDPDIGPQSLSYQWIQISGPSISLNNPNTAQPDFTPSITGLYRFELTVDDGVANDTDTVDITVNEPAQNQAPIANAGPDQNVDTGAQVQLDGSTSTDPDGGPQALSFSWSQISGPTVVLNGSDTAQPDFNADQAGTLQFELTVSDGDLNDTDIVLVEVTAPPPSTLPPEIDDVTPAHASTGISVNTHLLITFNKPIYNDQWVTGELQLYKSNGDILVESWDIQNSHIIDDYHIDITPSQPLETDTDYYIISSGTWIKLAVSPWNMSEPIEQGDWQFKTESGTPVPTVDSFTANPESMSENSLGPVTLSWETSNATSVSIDQGIGPVDLDGQTTVNPTSTTTYTLTADDGENTVQRSVTVTITPNQTPIANAGADQSVLVDDAVLLDGNASSDPDSGPQLLSYQWIQTAGAPVVLNNANQAQADFIADTSGSLTFELTVSDGVAQSTDETIITVNEPAQNQAPIANAGNDQQVYNGDNVQLNGNASSDPDSGPQALTYTWIQLSGPSVALNNSNTATPDFLATQNGTLVFELTVFDGDLSDSDTVTIEVVDQPQSTLPEEIDEVTPSHLKTGVALDTHILITFNKPIYNDQWVTGTLQLYKKDGDQLIEAWDIQSSHIVDDYNIDITPSQPLEQDTDYYIISEGTWIKLAVSPWNLSDSIDYGDWEFTTGDGSPVPIVDSFSASPDTLYEEDLEPVTLTWETSHATSVSIDQGVGPVAVDGSIQVNPSTTTTYTITATDGEHIDTETVTVTVLPGQAPALLWEDDFEGTTGSIQDHDPTWTMIMGQQNIIASEGAVLADPGPEYGGDDYGYHPQAATEVVITADILWKTVDATGVILVCPPGAVHESLYEMTIYQNRLQLLRYDGGGNPGIYATLNQSTWLGLPEGQYRIIMRANFSGGTWTLSGELQDPNDSFNVLATIPETQDSTHGASIGQGIGIYDNSNQESRIYNMRVEGR